MQRLSDYDILRQKNTFFETALNENITKFVL